MENVTYYRHRRLEAINGYYLSCKLTKRDNPKYHSYELLNSLIPYNIVDNIDITMYDIEILFAIGSASK